MYRILPGIILARPAPPIVVVAVLTALLVLAWPVFGQTDEVPDRPTGLTGTVTADAVTLTWTDPDDSSITGYQILRRDTSKHDPGVFVTINDDTGSAGVSYTDNTVVAGRVYKYRVKARNAAGLSERSQFFKATVPDAAAGVPARATGLTATATSAAVSLSWDDPDDSSITGYQILRRDRAVHASDVFVPIAQDTGNAAVSYTDDTVEAEKVYVYRVRARNSHGLGSRSPFFKVEVPKPDDGTREGATDLGDITQPGGAVDRDGSVDGSTDSVDYYRFELTVTRKVTLELREQDANADFLLEDAEGTALSRSEETGTSDESISQNLQSGSYYVKVQAKESASNDYQLRYEVEAAVQEQQQATPTPTPNSAATGKPAISGTVQVGQTLTVGTSGISDANGMTTPGFTYQWVKTIAGTDTDISGATGSTYVLTKADLAHTIKVRVGFTDDGGYSETVTSDATNLVNRPPNSIATGQPTITGTVEVGETLTAGTSAISDSNGLTSPGFSYHWLHSVDGTDTEISNASGSTYVLSASDAGKAFKVKVSFTDDDGYSETATSVATDTLLVSQTQSVNDTAPNPPSERSTRLEYIKWRTMGGANLQQTSLGWAYPKNTFERRFGHNVAKITIIPDPVSDSAVTFVIDPDDVNVNKTGHQLNVPAYGEDPLDITITVTDTADASRQKIYTGRIGRSQQPYAPEFNEGASATRSVNENTRGGVKVGGPVIANDRNGDEVSYSLKGGFNTNFLVGGTTGQIRSRGSFNHERKSSYSLTLVATDDSGRSDEIAITVNVINRNEPGVVQVSSGQAVVGTSVSASLEDPDGGLSNISWQWQRCDYRSSTDCTDISAATSSNYTPVADDSGKYLRAVASYDDGHGTGKSAQGISTKIASKVTTLDSLSLSGVTLDFRKFRYSYTVTAPASLTSTTVTATATASSGVGVSIQPSDSDADSSGHQVSLGGTSTRITVVVRTDDGSGLTVYTVTVNQ